MNKKVLILALAFVLVAAMSVGITLAYLSSTTDTVTNTFTIGKVEITLDETDVDFYGVKDGETRVIENTYKLIPGHFYVKDPTVHVKAGSEPCYVFVKVVDEIAAIEDATTVAKQMTDNGWIALDGVDNVYYYNTIVTTATDLKVFESFTIKADANLSSYATGKTITVTAYAVQSDGFTSAKDAWTKAPSNWTK